MDHHVKKYQVEFLNRQRRQKERETLEKKIALKLLKPKQLEDSAHARSKVQKIGPVKSAKRTQITPNDEFPLHPLSLTRDQLFRRNQTLQQFHPTRRRARVYEMKDGHILEVAVQVLPRHVPGLEVAIKAVVTVDQAHELLDGTFVVSRAHRVAVEAPAEDRDDIRVDQAEDL